MQITPLNGRSIQVSGDPEEVKQARKEADLCGYPSVGLHNVAIIVDTPDTEKREEFTDHLRFTIT